MNDATVYAGTRLNDVLSARLGLPTRPEFVAVFVAQVDIETADTTAMYGNNPLNVRPIPGGWPSQVGVSPGGFAMFDTLDHGIWACAANYANGPEYATVRGLIGDPATTAVKLAAAIEASPWDAGHYGPGNLQAKVREITGEAADMDRDSYARDVEPLVKETIYVMVTQDGATREAIAKIAAAAAPSPSSGVVPANGHSGIVSVK